MCVGRGSDVHIISWGSTAAEYVFAASMKNVYVRTRHEITFVELYNTNDIICNTLNTPLTAASE